MSGSRTVKVDILGDAKSVRQAFGDAGGAADGFSSKIAGIGKGIAVGVGALGAIAVGAGVAAFKLGDSFDSAFDTIRIGTGATGDVLSGLEDSFKNVVANVPTDFDTASAAIADLNTRLGTTGKPLEDLSTQFINLGRIAGEDVPGLIASGTRVFGDWSIATEDQGKALDYLFKTSQSTGIGVSALMDKVVQFGAPMRQMGFSFEETAALMGKWEKEGVNAELVAGSLRIALGKMAREGVTDTNAALIELQQNIKNAGSDGEATALAMEAFGAKAGPDMAAAIREGRFEIDDLVKTLEESGETINGVANETDDFGEKWTLFKNRAMVALEPVATKVFELAGVIMDKAGPALISLMAWAGSLAERLQGPLSTAFTLIRDGILTFIQAIQGNWSDNENIHGFHRAIGNIALVIREQVIPAVMTFAAFVTDTLWPILQRGLEVVGSLISAFNEGGLGGVFSRLGEIVAEVAPVLLEKLLGLVTTVGDWVVNTGIPFLAEKLAQWADAFGAWAVDAVPPMLEKLAELLEELGAWIADTGLPLLFDKLQLWGQALIDWIGPRIVPVLEALGLLLLAIGDWIVTTALPAIAEKLLEWGAQFVSWVGPQIGPLLTELGALLSSLGSWIIDTALPEIWAKVQEWGAQFVAWVGPRIVPLLEELGILLADIGGWIIDTALPEIINKLMDWGTAFVEWVAKDALPYIVPKLIALGDKILAWIQDTALPLIIDKLIAWGEAFLGFIAKDVLPYIGGKLAELLSAVSSWITDNAESFVTEAARIGASIVSGVAQGIYDFAATGLSAALQYLVDQIPGPLRKLLGIESPSRVMRDQVGIPIASGVAQGVTDGAPLVVEAIYTMGQQAVRAASNVHTFIQQAIRGGDTGFSPSGSVRVDPNGAPGMGGGFPPLNTGAPGMGGGIGGDISDPLSITQVMPNTWSNSSGPGTGMMANIPLVMSDEQVNRFAEIVGQRMERSIARSFTGMP